MRKKIRKSTWLTLALFAYVSIMAIYFLPRNTATSDLEKYITLGASYVIVAALWFVLRRKEKVQERRKKEEEHYNKLKEKQNEKIIT